MLKRKRTAENDLKCNAVMSGEEGYAVSLLVKCRVSLT